MTRIGFLSIRLFFFLVLVQMQQCTDVSHCFISNMFLNHIFLLKFWLGIICEIIIKTQQSSEF